MLTIDLITANALRTLTPPPRLQLSHWIEGHIVLPEGVSAQPGPVQLWPFQREIADAIGDPLIERVTLVKPVRVGFTTLLTSAVASFVANEPSPILCLLPAESDCRDYMVSDIEPIFSASRSVADALGDDRDEGERNTMLSRRFAGGSLKVVAAKAPRNLRRRNVRVLFIDDGGMHPKLIPTDQVDPSLSRDLGNGARIIAGIEFDTADRLVAYHVLPEAPGEAFTTYREARRIPASDIIHVFDMLFPGQVRGLSWLSPVLLKMRDRDEASDALLMQLKVSSLLTGFIEDLDGSGAGFEGEIVGSQINLSLEPGAMRFLPQGKKVTFSSPGQGLTQAVEFMRGQDREIAAGVGLTFEALTGDLGEANYSSARVGLLEFRRRAEMIQRNLIEGQLLRPLWKRWIDVRSLAGEITATVPDLADYRDVRFVPPGWQWVDPKSEVNADIAAIDAGLKSREEVVAGRGRDIDELDEELARDANRTERVSRCHADHGSTLQGPFSLPAKGLHLLSAGALCLCRFSRCL